MSAKKIRHVLEAVKHWSPHAADVRAAEEALKELEAIERAAKGLNQLDPRVGWNQQAWDDGLDLMDSIAKDAP